MACFASHSRGPSPLLNFHARNFSRGFWPCAPGSPAYCDGNDDALFVVFLLHRSSRCPTLYQTIQPLLPIQPASPSTSSSTRSFNRSDATKPEPTAPSGLPVSLSATTSAALPVFLACPCLCSRLCRSGELQAVKHAGWWLVHRDEFHRLLAPKVTLRSRAARQYIFLRNLQQLAAMLHPHEASSILDACYSTISVGL